MVGMRSERHPTHRFPVQTGRETNSDGLLSPSITFEQIPSDYAILKIIERPTDAGGDTLWASGYEAYDRLSPPIQKLAESLTATHYQPNFVKVKDKFDIELIDDNRGSPENTGLDFKAEQ
jgi:alpha-ketoglutarate-dependent taurine dioxygenase